MKNQQCGSIFAFKYCFKAALIFSKFNATTVQSEFKLGISTVLKPLSHKNRILMLKKYEKVKFILIDEIFMLVADLLMLVNLRF